ncbi:MAG: efflux RND transporter periplasmic adaptor subunit [Tolumonas sp.]|uniref:efflux RND transporter periplasmic adaptor subunit n=1 Tax=uncultured Tolumonas sp. TaxID=263765 RepID=UPI002A0A1745|nr:efflux RND transporter periplasmic adaptor subunit [uncultured Tolumonas sp.]MDD2841574.1 efflux RND transporter periplasmic adaptor subunit [Tolumonas sp.]
MPHHSALFRATPVALLTATLLLAGCKPSAEQNQASANMPAPEVNVITLQPQTLTLHTQLPGRTSAYRVAEVRPQVGGIIIKRFFREGSDVKAGQVLYQIDPATYEASLASAKAAWERAQASEAIARLKAERYRDLSKTNGVSRQENDDAEASWKQTVADVASAKAAVDTARINVEYTKLKAPISGRIGKSTVTEGALVTAQQTTALTTIQQLDPLYVDVSQSSSDLLKLKKALADGQLEKAGPQEAKVQLLMEDGSRYGESGKLQFSDVTVDEGTGSVTVRAIFANHEQQLLPGMFVRAELGEASVKDALLVPQLAVSHDPRGKATVLVVNAQGQVEQKAFETARSVNNSWLIKEGLSAGDQVIVNGSQKVQVGMKVKATPVDIATLTTNIPAAKQ